MSRIARAVRAGVLLAGVSVAARRAKSCRVERIEERIFRAMNSGPDRLRAPVWIVMQSGSLAAVFAATAAMRRRDRARAMRTLIAGITAWSVVKPVKAIVGRGRPNDHLDRVIVRGVPQSGSGFPSGHAAVATTLALVVTNPGTPARAGAVAAAVATGLARLYVGAHLPLDVAAGLAAGAAVNEAVGALVDRLEC